ncbi:uncharacterized protein CELE_T26E4.10 [Caenorhabditis elegans]|uniref:Uncharacterized protein n=1 Tax=Caenorhabditis elegans TaxID=6239 RepID=O45834_CAEEL|nr:Uncharacterized protein CELE_T26E4.10 [Caenorhabditis elegans]CAB03429.1 Uncharacterized protein CELE_T26E4.10 [Caenorhabditis elegans]|eukprot:NP_506939.1 Uncharacterized protein CELE_T26E4.10 [Caenorhabditis elegans]
MPSRFLTFTLFFVILAISTTFSNVVQGNEETALDSTYDMVPGEGVLGQLIRAKRQWGCGCDCWGCCGPTPDPAATPAPCNCGCCGCGWGK